MMTMVDQCLPDDILILILERLPPKSLLKFMCVSKSWYSLITSSYFISSHLHFHNDHQFNHHVVFKYKAFREAPQYSICHYGQEFANRTPLRAPVNSSTGTPFCSVAGSCNGVLCLYNSNERSLCLWNPSIHKFLILDQIPYLDYTMLGFGFDASTNDYKVVAIAPRYKFPQAKMYSLCSRTWKDVRFPSLPGLDHDRWHNIYINGVLYWIMYQKKGVQLSNYGHEYCAVFLKFDVHEETFGELQLPPTGGGATDSNLNLAVIDNSLAMLHFQVAETSYVVWQMKKDHVDVDGLGECWKVLYRIKMATPNLRGYWDGRVGGIMVDINPFVFDVRCGSLIFFDEEKASPTNVVEGKTVLLPGKGYPYSESLALLDIYNEIWRLKKGITSGRVKKL